MNIKQTDCELLSRLILLFMCYGLYGHTAVVKAVRGGHEEVLRMLLDYGCDASVVDNVSTTGNTAYDASNDD
jgi:hypothetical protein